MTLGQFATAVGAPRRWVQNAFAVLELSAGYTEVRARRLAVARALKQGWGLPLTRGWVLAAEVLAAWPAAKEWRGRAGAVDLVLDLERFLSDYAVRLSLAHTWYAEKRRGRPRTRRPKSGIAWAKEYGVDISLSQSALGQDPETRIRWNDGALEFIQLARAGLKR